MQPCREGRPVPSPEDAEGGKKEVQNMCSQDCPLYGGACGMRVSGRPLVRCEGVENAKETEGKQDGEETSGE